jgi:predicted alpha/beta-fold hydrolase
MIKFIAPRYGFRDAEDYYELCSPLGFMPEIRVPTMVMAACDDPWIPVECYREFNWSDNPAAACLCCRRRGDISVSTRMTARGPWCDLAVEKFIDRLAIMER